ncbi:hypothetical protein [Acinetobacter nosocomialis]|uniref:hypothetical protein n=1 Tax=Acinetobacter nosocomialis TaxID=106654 RepID=UPI0012503916|nr:hypothetical protein [Acinetobacter nosocomialis]
MDKFEEFYKQHCLDHFGYNPDLNWIFEKHEDGSYIQIEVENAKKVFQHQQAKVEELQRRNQMLNDNIKEQGQKLVYQNEVIETQAEKLLGLRDEKAELQKRVDAALEKLDQRHNELWKRWKDRADMQDQGAANAFEEAYWILEQALKGEG